MVPRAGLPAPEQAEARAMPADHGVWLDDDKHVRPARPQARQNEPEGPVCHADAGPTRRVPKVNQLLTKGEVFESQLRMGTES